MQTSVTQHRPTQLGTFSFAANQITVGFWERAVWYHLCLFFVDEETSSDFPSAWGLDKD